VPTFQLRVTTGNPTAGRENIKIDVLGVTLDPAIMSLESISAPLSSFMSGCGQ
jgi:hypothetical protein